MDQFYMELVYSVVISSYILVNTGTIKMKFYIQQEEEETSESRNS